MLNVTHTRKKLQTLTQKDNTKEQKRAFTYTFAAAKVLYTQMTIRMSSKRPQQQFTNTLPHAVQLFSVMPGGHDGDDDDARSPHGVGQCTFGAEVLLTTVFLMSTVKLGDNARAQLAHCF